ncbi:hypothetical protein ACNVED_06430 [Legionella sp. D16C41]|uniref:hypothetical protein n=1 Tax=Legionella sp. D16C41 TaxID=3402688 RepID=UPI003AF8FF81
MYKQLIASLLLYLISFLSWADSLPSQWVTANNKDIKIQVHLFTISTCPYCKNVTIFLNDFAKRNPWVEIHQYVINQDKSALLLLNNFLQEQSVNDFSVPAIFFCNSRWIGFKNTTKASDELTAGLNYCHEQVLKTGKLSETTVQTLQQMALANWYEGNIKPTASTSFFILLLAAIDALNPSATLLIFTFIGFLMLAPDNFRAKLLVLIGFIVGVGLARYFQIAYLPIFYEFMRLFRLPAILIGLGMVAFTLIIGNKIKQIPIGITVFSGLLAAFAVQSYEQFNSLPNFALIVKQWLINQQFSIDKQIFYQLAYTLIYLLSLTLAGLIVVLLFHRTRWRKYLIAFRRLTKAFLLVVGAILIIYPYGLNNLFFIFITLVLSLLITWLLPKFYLTKENF